MLKNKLVHRVGAIVLVALLYFGNLLLGRDNNNSALDFESGINDDFKVATQNDSALIVRSFDSRQSNIWVQAPAHVIKVLTDDNDGSRHQRFLVELANGHTLLIAHNIDLAPRIPLQQGDAIEFRGEYEWNDKGGVIHWTHHDPKGRERGGWISHQRKTYE